MMVLLTVFIILLMASIAAGGNQEDEGLISLNSQILEIEQFLSSEKESDPSSLAQIWKALGAICEHVMEFTCLPPIFVILDYSCLSMAQLP